MDEITILVSALHEKVMQMVTDDMDYVTVSIIEADECNNEKMPAALHFEAQSKKRMYEGIDYEEVEEIQID